MRSFLLFIAGLVAGSLSIFGFITSQKPKPVTPLVRYQLVSTRVHGTRIDGIENEMTTVLRIDTATGKTWVYLVGAHGQDTWQEITDDPIREQK